MNEQLAEARRMLIHFFELTRLHREPKNAGQVFHQYFYARLNTAL
jgi:hypothetical protein